jgi:hypothetical protein
MSRCALGHLTFALLSLLATTSVLARSGVNRSNVSNLSFLPRVPHAAMQDSHFKPRIIARHVGIRDGLRFHGQAELQSGLPTAIWPYSSFTDTLPLEVPSTQSEAPVAPMVTLMSGLPNGVPDRTVPETTPDYSYVAGCRAIPNGYHCDTPHSTAAATPGG